VSYPEEQRVSDRPGEMDERDVDERFASIVAAWEGPLPTSTPTSTGSSPGEDPAEDDGQATTAAAEEGGEDPDDGPDPTASPTATRDEHRPPWVNPSPLDLIVPASSWRVMPPPSTPDTGGRQSPPSGPPAGADDDEHYEPPPVTLPPQEDLHFWGAVIGLVGGPLLLLYVALARPFHSERWFAAGVVLSLVGFGLLVLRQPRHRDPTDGDDGARV
jgi:hypothetical protein